MKANVILTDVRPGILRAAISGDYINDLRTSARLAITAKLLETKTSTAAVIGTGLQATPVCCA